MSYTSNMFRSLVFRKDAQAKLHKAPRAGIYWFFGLVALFTFLTLPLVTVIASLKAMFGGGGMLAKALPASLPGLIISLFVIYLIVFVLLALFFAYALHLFSRLFGAKTKFRDIIAATTPAIIPYCVLMLPMFVVLLFGFFGGNMSDAVGKVIGVIFNILLVVLPILSFVYVLFGIRYTTKLSWGRTLGASFIALVLFAMLATGAYFLLTWLI